MVENSIAPTTSCAWTASLHGRYQAPSTTSSEMPSTTASAQAGTLLPPRAK